MNEKNVVFAGEDDAMISAYESAQQSFKYFWREAWWERSRIVPALDMAAVKLPFTDGPGSDGSTDYEHMWVGDVDFDGATVSGTLMNTPQSLRSIEEGDAVSMPFSHLTDWMISADGLAYGSYTVQHIRAAMEPGERKQHDDAWGLDFGDPSTVRLEIWKKEEPKGGYITSLFGGRDQPETHLQEFSDHPACTNMLETIAEHLRTDPEMVNAVDEDGWTVLHREALAGNFGIVKLLLGCGADAGARTPGGRTPADLARDIGWADIADYLDGQSKV